MDICMRWIFSRVWYGQSLEGSSLEGSSLEGSSLEATFEAQCLQRHWRGVPKLSENISSCSLTRYIVCSFQPPQGFTIFSCHWVFNRTTAHQAALLLISWLFPKFPIFLGFYGVPRNTALWLQATSWEVWSLPYFILVLRRRRFWWADLLLSNGVFSIDIFPCVLWDVEDKV